MDMAGVVFLNRLTQNIAHMADLALLLSSRIFGLALFLALTAFLAWRLRPGWRVVLSMGLAFAITDNVGHRLLKPMIARARPCLVNHALFIPAGCGSGFSMPSLHAANAFAIAVLATMLWPKTASIVFPLAIAIALSRVGLGVHYLSDIVVGAMFGSLVGVALGLSLGRGIRDKYSAFAGAQDMARSLK